MNRLSCLPTQPFLYVLSLDKVTAEEVNMAAMLKVLIIAIMVCFQDALTMENVFHKRYFV